MSSMKVISGSLVLFCALLMLFARVESTYADNPDQSMTTTRQILTILISDSVTLAPGGLVTLTGYTTLSSSEWQTVPVGAQSTSIDHVEVRIDARAPITATLDGLGNWSVAINDCTSPSKTYATVVAKDGTRAMADFTLCGPPALATAAEPTPPVRFDKFIFLPVIAAK